MKSAVSASSGSSSTLGRMEEDDVHEPTVVEVTRAVGLALRAHRRSTGQSQRAYAAARGLSRPLLSRAEVDASRTTLDLARDLLTGTGFELVVVRAGRLEAPTWDLTDLQARTRSGSRFPPHREVRPTLTGPMWWWYHEALGGRGNQTSPAPVWSAEGFRPPPGTRYGPRPKDATEGPRWPY